MEKRITERAELLNSAALFRGGVINGVILLERIVDSFLSWYFTNDTKKGDELMDMFFASKDSVAMKRKTILFKKIIKKNFKSFYDQNELFFKNIDFIIEQRNIFAHYLLDTSEESIKNYTLNKTLTFIIYHDLEIVLHYPPSEITKIADKLEKTVETASQVYETLREGTLH